MRQEWLDPFSADVKIVFAAAEKRVLTYPEPLAGHALEQLQLLNPTLRDSGHSYIGYISPLWMQHINELARDKAHQLSTACLLHMLYFLNLDDVMDEQPDDTALKLSLGNLYYMDALHAYSTLFEPSSAFWIHFRKVNLDWAVSVQGEQFVDYFQENPLLISQKAAPSQLGLIGILLLLNQSDQIDLACSALNIVLMTLQMTDDFTDTKQDALHGNYNSYLSHISAALQLNYPVDHINEDVHNNVYNSSLMNSYVDIALHYNDKLNSSNIEITQLKACNDYLLRMLVQVVHDVQLHKKSLYQGGFHYWINESQPVVQDSELKDSV